MLVRWQKRALFVLRWFMIRAKPNVQFVLQAKIVFKKCSAWKNKNTEALAFESPLCWFICSVTLCLFLFIFAISYFRLVGNLKKNTSNPYI